MHAFVCKDGKKLIDLGTFGGVESQASSINDRGQIAGSFTAGDGTSRAIVISDGIVKDLALAGVFAASSAAISINNAGQVAGLLQRFGSAGRVFLYSEAAGVAYIESRSGEFVNAMNNAGQIVGGLSNGTTTIASLSVNGAMTDLNALVERPAGWTLMRARGINDSGQIVGEAKYHGLPRAVLLTPIPDSPTRQ